MSTSVVTSNSASCTSFDLIARKNQKDSIEEGAFSILKVNHTARKDFEKSIGTTFIQGSNGSDLARATAWYAEGSTERNPILSIEYSDGKEVTSADISINDIDPSHATALEMFALCCYADDHDKGVKSTFGTFQAMKTFRTMAIHNQYTDDTGDINGSWENFSTQRINWESMVEKMTALLSQCQDATQYEQGKTILKLFSDRSNQNIKADLDAKWNNAKVDGVHTLDINYRTNTMKNQLRGDDFDAAEESLISRSIRIKLAKSAYL